MKSLERSHRLEELPIVQTLGRNEEIRLILRGGPEEEEKCYEKKAA